MTSRLLHTIARVSRIADQTSIRRFSAAHRHYETASSPQTLLLDVEQLLAKPTWSVRSLLADDHNASADSKVTGKQLRHLLRLSALPPPKDAGEEASMIATLSAQLRFVEEIQKIDTAGVEPLQSLRDETSTGEREAELNLAALKEALGQEEIRGKHYRRIRRRETAVLQEAEGSTTTWDPLQHASETVGRYFVVRGGKDQ